VQALQRQNELLQTKNTTSASSTGIADEATEAEEAGSEDNEEQTPENLDVTKIQLDTADTRREFFANQLAVAWKHSMAKWRRRIERFEMKMAMITQDLPEHQIYQIARPVEWGVSIGRW
jgi:hypothetical protein